MEYSVDGASFSATEGTKWPWCHRMGTNDYTLLWERGIRRRICRRNASKREKLLERKVCFAVLSFVVHLLLRRLSPNPENDSPPPSLPFARGRPRPAILAKLPPTRESYASSLWSEKLDLASFLPFLLLPPPLGWADEPEIPDALI